MTRSERLLAIVQTLRGRHTPATAADLAGEFDVSERTIYRDITVLVSRGALIEGAAGFGYTLKPGTFLPPMTFAPDEADAIMLGLRFVMRRGDPALVDGARSAMAKIAEVMPDDAAHQARLDGWWWGLPAHGMAKSSPRCGAPSASGESWPSLTRMRKANRRLGSSGRLPSDFSIRSRCLPPGARNEAPFGTFVSTG